MRSLVKRFQREFRFYSLVRKDPRTPRRAKWLLGAALAYPFQPLQVIPNFIPVIGWLDDAVIVPGLAYLAMRTVPAEVVADCRRQVAGVEESKKLKVKR
jgi:uncharacterized membrane protein YkvA (DUF1232 family)